MLKKLFKALGLTKGRFRTRTQTRKTQKRHSKRKMRGG